jgi:patatin-like phospholipase/acyl hydrolase
MVANSLRVLCLDGGGVKGYTSLLILKRIFRTMVSDGTLAEEPKPCDVFDLIAGTSTGGIIAVMLGRLHMTIDECLREYEKTGEAVFGKNISSSKLGKMLKAGSGSAFYDINILQERIRKVVSSRGFDAEQSFKEENTTCKV